MEARLADRLRSARRRHFVGRDEAKALFQATLAAESPDCAVIFVHGPGGLGKTSLLHEFAHLTQQAGGQAVYLDARNLEPAPESFCAALHAALGIEVGAPLLAGLGAQAQQRRIVILLDTYEALAPLDEWLRNAFLPQLPENVLVVAAGREEPGRGWRSDPGWQSLLRTLPLRSLSADESAEYLQRRAVPEAQHAALIRFTHGYPLALSLVADLFDQQPGYHFQPENAVDLVSTLVSQLLEEAPGPAHRATLELCCLVRGTTEALLADVLRTPDAHDLFRWLGRLSFIDSGPRGLFPHDMAREVLHADLRWRNHAWYAELHRRARASYVNRFQQTQGVEQQRALFDLVYLHRHNPVVQPVFAWQTAVGGLPDRLEPEDSPLLCAMVERHEGPEAAAIAAHWLQRRPDLALVLRDGARRPIAFLCAVALEFATPADLAIDPATRATRTWIDRHAPLRAGERATLFRFWMAADHYQDVSPAQSILVTNMMRHYLTTPRLAHAFVTCAAPDFWQPAFDYADFERVPAADFSVGGRSYGVFGHDWRVTPPIAWLTLMGERELGMPVTPTRSATPLLVVLSEVDFADAVRAALHDLGRADRLRENPLLWSRLVVDALAADAPATDAPATDSQDAGSEPAARVAILRQMLRAAVEEMRTSPRDSKLYRALHHTYIQPAPTQEAAAELLDLPFSTYRRHLKEGVQRVVQTLWAGETGNA